MTDTKSVVDVQMRRRGLASCSSIWVT